MLKRISIIVLIFILSPGAVAKTEKYTAPIKWERYKVSEKDVSVLFPKLPILIESSDVCVGQATNKYIAYADGIVYGLNVTSKIKQGSFMPCSEQRKFDESSFNDRLMRVKKQLKVSEETKLNQNNLEVTKIKSLSESYTYWLINDYKNKRWFEIWVVGTTDENNFIKNFVESLEISKDLQGIKIGKGSSRMLGDEGVADSVLLTVQEKDAKELEKLEAQNIRIVFKPYPKYSDAARKASVQGTVSLRVTFLASGAIGNISVVKELPNGLTEQAIAAASKIVFIPLQRNGIYYSVTKVLEYSFSIY